ncbi:MAG TPA: mechanosensitive ion channel family protein [Bacillota bacterium]|nr:mechanosensitive ion channel family protein [Bacillota bacterium]
MQWETLLENNEIKYTLISIGIFLLFLLLRKIFITYIYKFVLKASSKTPTRFFTELLEAFKKPLQWMFVIVGFYIAVHYFPYIDEENKLFLQIIQSLIIVLIIWGFFNLASATSLLFSKINRKTNMQVDQILIPFISRGIRVVIVAIGISIIAEIFNYNISGFVAGLGLGGLAVALAAQEVLANLFGGFVIITERPFSIGDWILTPSVEGTVEDISFRSTKVRTFADAVVTVPNSTLANEAITNWSKMGKRRVSFDLRVTYSSPVEHVKRALKRIEELLQNHDEVHQETIAVRLNEFADIGSEIMIYYFTKTTVWMEHLAVKEEINYEIMNILEEENVEIAIPSRRLVSAQNVEGTIEGQ